MLKRAPATEFPSGLDPRAIDALLWPLLHRYAPLCPVALWSTLRAFHAPDEIRLWQAVEKAFGQRVEAPFYAVPWPGAQALACQLLDDQVDVARRKVLDLGCGGGLSAIAAALKGASHVLATDIDPLALSACRGLAAAHGVDVQTVGFALPTDLGTASTEEALLASGLLEDVDLILIGDLAYSRALAEALRVTLSLIASRYPQMQVLLADSGRPYFAQRVATLPFLRVQREYTVPVQKALEGCEERVARVYTVTSDQRV